MRNAVVVFAAATIMVLGIVGSSVIFLDEQRLKLLVAQHVENHTGRRIEIQGPLRLRLFPGLRLTAEQVIMLPPEGFDGPELFRAEQVDMRVRLLALVRGRVDASDVRLSGARINLHTDPSGRSNLEGLGRDRPPGLSDWTSGPISLEHAVVSFTDAGRAGREILEMDRIDLAGVTPGSPVEFRFRGNMEEPAAFDSLEVDGLLVPGNNGNARLSNMRLLAVMDGGRYQAELRGNVSYSSQPPMSLDLDGGMLMLNQHRFLVEGAYLSGDRPYLSASLASDFFDVDVLALVGKLAELSQLPAESGILTALRGFDFDVVAEVSKVAELGMVLEGARVEAAGRSGLVALELDQTSVPGAELAASIALDLRHQPAQVDSLVTADVSSAAALLRALRLPPFLDGQGDLLLELAAVSGDLIDQPASWAGHGTVELWGGEWPLLEGLEGAQASDPVSQQFDLLRAELSLLPGSLEVGSLSVVSPGRVVSGNAGFQLEDQGLRGQLQVHSDEGLEQLELAGSLIHPQLTRLPLLVPPEQ